MKIFLDMDGVMTNWSKAAHEIHGLEYTEWPYEYGPAGWAWNKKVGISDEKFWGAMGYDFWANLEWTKDGTIILGICEEIVGKSNVCLLTSPCLTKGAVEGRLEWIRRELPMYRRQILIGACKEMCASFHSVLVDDYDVNIEKFTDAGGWGITVPRPWNRLYHVSDSVIHVKRSLQTLKDMPNHVKEC